MGDTLNNTDIDIMVMLLLVMVFKLPCYPNNTGRDFHITSKFIVDVF